MVARTLGIDIEPGVVRAAALTGKRAAWVAEATFTSYEELADALARLAAERPRGARAARVALGEGLAECKVLERMPRLSPGDLRAHVALLPRRYFLQNGALLATDAVPLELGNGRDHGKALLAAAAEPLLDALHDGLRAAGLRLLSVAPAAALPRAAHEVGLRAAEPLGDAAGAYATACAAVLAGAPTVSLLPAGLRREHRRSSARRARGWALAGAAALVLAGGTYAHGLRHQRTAAQRELAALGPALLRARGVRRDLDATTDALTFLQRVQSGAPRRAALLAEVARVLPDSAFLVLLRLEADGHGVLVGYAPRAGRAVSVLERARGIAAPALDGPVTRETLAGRAWERFTAKFVLTTDSVR